MTTIRIGNEDVALAPHWMDPSLFVGTFGGFKIESYRDSWGEHASISLPDEDGTIVGLGFGDTPQEAMDEAITFAIAATRKSSHEALRAFEMLDAHRLNVTKAMHDAAEVYERAKTLRGEL